VPDRSPEQLAREVADLRTENALLNAALSELARAEERFRVLFERSSDAHLIFDDTGIIDCNAAAVELLRCRDKNQLLSLHPAQLSPELQPDGRRSMEKCLEMDRIAFERGFHRFEWVHRRMNGEDFPVEVSLTPVQLQQKRALIVVWHDQTELRAREAALREQAAILIEQAGLIRRLSTPVIAVAEGVLLVPIVGALDAERAETMTGAALQALSARRARTVIIDLTGVERFDAATAAHLARLGAAAGLLGTEAVLAGIGPAVATAIVDMGVDLGRTRTVATAGEAIARALARA
jgi:PAS domain S-box-containing protein